MNNVIMILMDSVTSDCLSKGRTAASSTPFLDKLINEGCFAPNIYSYGPYTDAATKGLYCGVPTLDDYGYYYQLNESAENHYKIFKQNGYETYGFYYPYYINGPKIYDYVDHTVFLSGMVYSSIWHGKFDYYAKLLKERELSEKEMRIVVKFTALLLDAWSDYYKRCLSDLDAPSLIDKAVGDISFAQMNELLQEQKGLFETDPNAYVLDILRKGMDHPLASLDGVDVNRFCNTAFFKEYIYKKHRKFFSYAARIDFWRNLKNLPFSLKTAFRGVKAFCKSRNDNDLRYSVSYLRTLFSTAEMKTVSLQKEWQYIVSARSQIDALTDKLAKRENDAPFFASLHFLEAHNSISYFTYDTTDPQKIDEEIDVLERFVKTVGKNFKGNLSYQLSLRYLDFCIEKLFSFLNEKGLADNTTLLLVSDHGTSYTYHPLRETVVNTFYKENYHVPMILWSKQNPPMRREGLYSAIDILPTLLEQEGISCPAALKGRNIQRDEKGRQYIITEYMGPGCPDMMTREVWISARDSRFSVAFKAPIHKPFDKAMPFSIFDLQNDPLEQKNLSEKESVRRAAAYLADVIAQRFEEIQKETKVFTEQIGE